MKAALGLAYSTGSRFRLAIEELLEDLPLETPSGEVIEATTDEQFGFRGGNHEPIACWIYRPDGSELEMRFGFYENFTPDDLICKVVPIGARIPQGEGASIQLNADQSLRARRDGELILEHSGLVTVAGKRRSRADLLKAIGQTAPDTLTNLGGLNWPYTIGSTDDLKQLLDTLFVYAFCIAQAKRFFRGDRLLPASLPPIR